MKVAVRFDGKVFVPKEPVNVPIGTEAEVEVNEADDFERWLKWLESAPAVPQIDLVNLDRGDLYP